jgi:hypothetical protein
MDTTDRRVMDGGAWATAAVSPPFNARAGREAPVHQALLVALMTPRFCVRLCLSKEPAPAPITPTSSSTCVKPRVAARFSASSSSPHPVDSQPLTFFPLPRASADQPASHQLDRPTVLQHPDQPGCTARCRFNSRSHAHPLWPDPCTHHLCLTGQVGAPPDGPAFENRSRIAKVTVIALELELGVTVIGGRAILLAPHIS